MLTLHSFECLLATSNSKRQCALHRNQDSMMTPLLPSGCLPSLSHTIRQAQAFTPSACLRASHCKMTVPEQATYYPQQYHLSSNNHLQYYQHYNQALMSQDTPSRTGHSHHIQRAAMALHTAAAKLQAIGTPRPMQPPGDSRYAHRVSRASCTLPHCCSAAAARARSKPIASNCASEASSGTGSGGADAGCAPPAESS